jgi:phosphatidylserine/phosphatidylglycerophosphate/cardiolipin synthase-like enzyme
VFPIAVSLAIAALSPILPAASISTDAAIAVCFAPEDCAAFAVRSIDNAESEILVSAYSLTVGSGIVGALMRANERGVDVKLIADRSMPCGRGSGIEPLAAAGVPIWIDDRARIAHLKAMVIDGEATLMGSSPRLTLRIGGERLAVSMPFGSREDWCRVSSAEALYGTR